MNDMANCIGGIVCTISLTLCAYAIGNAEGRKNLQDKAVKDGKAEYYLDENHMRQWRWKP